MELIFNYVFAWIAVLFTLLLSVKYIIRKLAESNFHGKKLFQKLNRSMRAPHILLGLLVIVFGLVHGIYSSQAIFSFNLGTAAWIVSILLCLNYYAKSVFPRTFSWLALHRFLTVLFIFLIVVHIIDVGGIRIFEEFGNDRIVYEQPQTEQLEPIEPIEPIEPTEPIEPIEEYNANLFGVTLKDGIYTGVADGFGKDLTVEVEVAENSVISITVISHNERNARFYAEPINVIPQKIIETQSLDVDAVSGATYTSVGILNAVNDALSQAVLEGELPPLIKLR